jgi:hypothetical protein
LKCIDSGTIFNVHESLLRNSAPDLDIQQRFDEFLSAEVGSMDDAVEIFVNWIYTRETPGDFASVMDEVNLFIPAHALGREVGCVVFMDVMLDELINRMTSDSGHFQIDEIIKASGDFEEHSGGWNFLIDLFVQRSPLDCGDQLTSIYKALSNAEDHEFLSELARRICEDTGVPVPDATDDQEFSKMLISGFFAARIHAHDPNEDYPDTPYPRTENICQNHRHTELGLPCYRRQR